MTMNWDVAAEMLKIATLKKKIKLKQRVILGGKAFCKDFYGENHTPLTKVSAENSVR